MSAANSPMVRLNFVLPDVDLDLPAEMLAPPPTLRSLLFNRTTVAIYLVILLGGGTLALSTWSLGARETRIRASLDELATTGRRYKDDIQKAQALSNRRGTIRAYLDTVKVVDEHRFAVVHALDQLDRSRPRDTWLEKVETVREDSLTRISILRLTAIAPTQELVAEYQRNLEGSPWLRNVQFQSSELVMVSGQQAVRFSLTAETRRPDKEFLTTEAITSEGLVSGQRPLGAPPVNGPVLAPLTAITPGAPTPSPTPAPSSSPPR